MEEMIHRLVQNEERFAVLHKILQNEIHLKQLKLWKQAFTQWIIVLLSTTGKPLDPGIHVDAIQPWKTSTKPPGPTSTPKISVLWTYLSNFDPGRPHSATSSTQRDLSVGSGSALRSHICVLTGKSQWCYTPTKSSFSRLILWMCNQILIRGISTILVWWFVSCQIQTNAMMEGFTQQSFAIQLPVVVMFWLIAVYHSTGKYLDFIVWLLVQSSVGLKSECSCLFNWTLLHISARNYR